jgi:hypothetical protein
VDAVEKCLLFLFGGRSMHLKPEAKKWLQHIHMPESHGLIMRTERMLKERPIWEIIIVLVVLSVIFILLALWLG